MRLKHCPFCGDEAVSLIEEISVTHAHTKFLVRCSMCGASTQPNTSSGLAPHAVAFAKECAIDAWNDRITHEQDLALRVVFALV